MRWRWRAMAASARRQAVIEQKPAPAAHHFCDEPQLPCYQSDGGPSKGVWEQAAVPRSSFCSAPPFHFEFHARWVLLSLLRSLPRHPHPPAVTRPHPPPPAPLRTAGAWARFIPSFSLPLYATSPNASWPIDTLYTPMLVGTPALTLNCTLLTSGTGAAPAA